MGSTPTLGTNFYIMPKLVRISNELFRIEHSEFESKILKARKEAKKVKNKFKVNTLEKLIDYTSVFKDFMKIK